MYIKQFLDWICVKQKLDERDHDPPLVSIGDLWWASVGENVGSEISGKGSLFTRPVIILKKLSHRFYLVIPTSTKIREGSWYVGLRHKEQDMVACLHQIRTIDHRRLSSKLGTLDDQDFANVVEGFTFLYIW